MRSSIDTQLDLFGSGGVPTSQSAPKGEAPTDVNPASLNDVDLLAAIPDAGIPLVFALIEEVGIRKLPEAVPALDRFCRLFKGFGIEREVPEQAAALGALAAIGGHESQSVISRLLADRVIQGPTIKIAACVAATLRCRLRAETVLSLLASSDPEVRTAGCRLALPQSDIFSALVGLLVDVDKNVRVSAACALGRFGRQEARGPLKNLLRKAPTALIVEAIAPVADEECIVILGRLARTDGNLANAALNALSDIDHPAAVKICAMLPEKGDLLKESK